MQDAVHVKCKMQGDTCRVICVQLHSMSSTLRWHFSAANDPAPAFARAGVQMAAAHNDAQPTLRLFVPILHFGIVPAPICLKSNQVWFTARWQGSTWTTWHLLGQPPGVKFWAQGTYFLHRPPNSIPVTRSKLAFTPHLLSVPSQGKEEASPKNRNDSTVIQPALILQSAHVKDNMRQVLWKPQTSIAERWTFIQPSAPPIQSTCRQSSEIWKSLVFHFLTTFTAWNLINKLHFINKQDGLITDLYVDRSPLWKRIRDCV